MEIKRLARPLLKTPYLGAGILGLFVGLIDRAGIKCKGDDAGTPAKKMIFLRTSLKAVE